MKLYHFLSKKWGLKALKWQRLKVSRYNELNDPFELLAMSLSDKDIRRIVSESKSRINDRLRILCCSKSWASPLLWSHYAQKHHGVALELDVPSNLAHKVGYAKDRTEIDTKIFDEGTYAQIDSVLLNACQTKYSQWSYEDEYRIQLKIDECVSDGKHEFIALGNNIRITGLVLGPLCKITQQEIEKHLPLGDTIEVTTSRIAFKSFKVVEQNLKPTYKAFGGLKYEDRKNRTGI